MIKYAVVNAEYEYELFKEELGINPKDYQYSNRLAYEYLFFFINKDRQTQLLSNFDYPDIYRHHLEELGISMPRICRAQNLSAQELKQCFNWYGSLTNIKQEKDLNSKLWMYNFLKSTGLEYQTPQICYTYEDIRKNVVSGKEYLVKSPYLMSGTGNISFKKIDSIGKGIVYPLFLEPLYTRLLDVSYQFDPQANTGFYYIGHSTLSGQYLGGMIFQNEEDLDSHVCNLGLSSFFSLIKVNFSHILKEVQKLKPCCPIGLDSFIYKIDGKPKVYTLCDINYRVTMGSLLLSLKRFLVAGGVAQILSVRTCLGRERYKFFRYDKESKTGVIILSPDFSKNLTVLLVARSIDDLEKIKVGFYKIIFLYSAID